MFYNHCNRIWPPFEILINNLIWVTLFTKIYQFRKCFLFFRKELIYPVKKSEKNYEVAKMTARQFCVIIRTLGPSVKFYKIFLDLWNWKVKTTVGENDQMSKFNSVYFELNHFLFNDRLFWWPNFFMILKTTFLWF